MNSMRLYIRNNYPELWRSLSEFMSSLRRLKTNPASSLNYVLNNMLKYAPRRIQIWIKNQKMKRRILNRTRLILEKELECKYREALRFLIKRQGVESLGDYLEFGVYNGTSLICMHHVLEDLGIDYVRLFGFDSFEGLPITAETDDGGHWRPGQFKSEYDFTKQVIAHNGVKLDRVVLVKGFFGNTLNDELIQRYHITKASIIMVDCDMYLSAKEVLEFCASLIRDEAIIFFDDWYVLADRNMGEKLAFDEFLKAHPYFVYEKFGTYPPNGEILLVSRKS